MTVEDVRTSPVVDPGVDHGDVIGDFTTAATAFADRTAVECDGSAISYRDLENAVRGLAESHRPRGDGSPTLIGGLVGHSPGAVRFLLGVLAAGAVYCPVDAALPVARRQAVADVLGVDRVHPTEPAPVPLPTGPRRDPSSRPTDPAYVLCTSGSTGAPKPVVVSRRALTVTVRALRRLFELVPEDRVLQFAALAWDTSLEEMLPALTCGAAVVFDDRAQAGALPNFVRMLADRRVTVVDLPTAFWHELVLFLHEERMGLPDCLRLVVIGGERIDPTRLRQWRELDVAGVQLLNTYGCTETTMVTHSVLLSGPGADAALDGAPLGRPLPHVRDHVTADGELLVSGPALASGYLGSPELTADRFPVADHGHGTTRWFRTGDLVGRADDGLLYGRGRADDEVKVLGVRIHPAEVETQLLSHPAVAGAVVVGERRLGRTTLAAFVVLGGSATAAELKRHLRERLPSQVVPTRFEFIARLVLTASGKVDRTATVNAAADHNNEGANT
ncbi:amino acid adenylation domain-containing protein [Mycobacterium hodleri]|uniref:amino acid adenylation domain-containing protein n=1 Tax=Mycolicibacterium hodleri TaxID=49897 RepID=UPI0021F2CCCD|nr:amino acid adenylation domain-containing protein [Mycolicibacterium hodleri]MCV7135830.1 amino acid adenylation domain-containing protein [Mycolicibacterium hodleri]